jgi:hypothetical protein
MLELIELIIASPVGAAAATTFQNSLLALMAVADCDECGFNDLGKLLFGGLILAVLVGIAVSVIRHRAQRGTSESSNFVSIRSSDSRK